MLALPQKTKDKINEKRKAWRQNSEVPMRQLIEWKENS